tara:strand:- start:1562 stop:2272 length:711 start_codon:yes stop_codon:yes gene_type:complete
MSTNKGISILMSFYNGKAFFEEQFLSIISQMNESDELIIRDDGSNSKKFILDVCKKFPPSKLMYDANLIKVISSSNIGVNKSFLELLKYCKNDVCVFCDQDDVWTNRRLKSVRDNYSSDLHCVNFSINDSIQLKNNYVPNVLSIFFRNRIPGCCMSGRVDYILESIHQINDNLIYDHGLIFKALIEKKVLTIDYEVGVKYRRHSNTLTKFGSFLPNGIFEAIRLRYSLFYLLLGKL